MKYGGIGMCNTSFPSFNQSSAKVVLKRWVHSRCMEYPICLFACGAGARPGVSCLPLFYTSHRLFPLTFMPLCRPAKFRLGMASRAFKRFTSLDTPFAYSPPQSLHHRYNPALSTVSHKNIGPLSRQSEYWYGHDMWYDISNPWVSLANRDCSRWKDGQGCSHVTRETCIIP